MNFLKLALLGSTILCAGAAQAVEITGGSVGVGYSAFTDDTDVDRVSIEGSLELGFDQSFGMQADVSHLNYGTENADSSAFGLHGLYHLDSATSLGAFYTMEDFSGTDLEFFGIEAGHDTGMFEIEGYLATDDADMIGIMGRYDWAGGLGLTGSIDRAEIAGLDVTRVGLKAERGVGVNGSLYAEVGTVHVDTGPADDTELFLGIGGSIEFGRRPGTTFEGRSFGRIFPGL